VSALRDAMLRATTRLAAFGQPSQIDVGAAGTRIRQYRPIYANEALGFELNRNDFVPRWVPLRSAVLTDYVLNDLSIITISDLCGPYTRPVCLRLECVYQPPLTRFDAIFIFRQNVGDMRKQQAHPHQTSFGVDLSRAEVPHTVPGDNIVKEPASLTIPVPEHVPVYAVTLRRSDVVILQDGATIRSPIDAALLAWDRLKELDREHLLVPLLDTKIHLIGINTVSIGTLDCSLVHPKEVFKPTIIGSDKRIPLPQPSGISHPTYTSTVPPLATRQQQTHPAFPPGHAGTARFPGAVSGTQLSNALRNER